MKDADAASSGGFEDRSDIGVEVGAPSGSEAVGDLAEDDAGPQGLLGAVVGGRDVAVGDEDEQVLAVFLDDAQELLTGLGVRNDLEQRVELGLEAGVIDYQGGGVGQVRTAPSDADRPLHQGQKAGGEGIVTTVD